MTPPNGRMKNGMANDAYASSSPVRGSVVGKKRLAKTSEATVP